MPKYSVKVTYTKVETATFEVEADDIEDAARKGIADARASHGAVGGLWEVEEDSFSADPAPKR